ncbi:MAG: PBP1A family penicillin-binding protein [Alphaproteobacteria bacterium]|nr:PBP1A family penicillin-binding protein [Alphaproteobacteria bacterium]
MARRKKAHDHFDEAPSQSGFFGTLFRWIFVLSIWGGIILGGVVLWYGKDLLDLTRKSNFERKRSVVVLANDGQSVLANYGESSGKRVRVQDLPPYVGNAVLAIEDRRFYYHIGVDPIGLLRAAFINWKEGRIVQGGSTITQQLAKNLFLKPERTFKRKVQEAILALWLELKYTKDEILTSYLNRVYFGAGAYGIDAAAHVYFDKPPERLTLEEAAMLAGLLKAPSRLSPEVNPDRALERMNMVLTAMEDAGFMDVKKDDEEGSKSGRPTPPRKPISLRSNNDGSRYFADWVLDRANELIGISGADLTIVTTLDPKLERATQEAVRASLDTFFKDAKKRPQAAVVVLDRDGAIRAMLGGTSYRDSQFNRATQALRQPGSSFKPFVYLAALEKGWRPGDPIEDAPIQLGDYAPANHDGQYYGFVPLSSAMALSLNTAAVRMASEVGIESVIDVARRAGIKGNIVPNYSAALGTAEVTVLEMAQAYNTIANRGIPAEPYGIISIRDSENDNLYTHESLQQPPVLDGDACNRLIAMMQEVVTRGTGGRAYPGFVVAGKTGTSSDYRDTWFVGMSGVAVAAVWVGNDDNTQMRHQYGGNAPADIFRQVIKSAQEGREVAGLSTADPYEMSFGSAFSSEGLSGVFTRIFGDGETAQPVQQIRGGQRMRPIVEMGKFND